MDESTKTILKQVFFSMLTVLLFPLFIKFMTVYCNWLNL